MCLIKTHIDIINDFSYESTIEPLLELSRKHQFMIFEDKNLLILAIRKNNILVEFIKLVVGQNY